MEDRDKVRYKIHREKLIWHLINIKNLLENIKIKKNFYQNFYPSINIEEHTGEIIYFIAGSYAFLEEMKKELNQESYTDKDELLKYIDYTIERIKTSQIKLENSYIKHKILNDLKKLSTYVGEIYKILDYMSKEQSLNNSKSDIGNTWDNIKKVGENIQSLEDIINNMKNEESTNIDSIIYNIDSLIKVFSKIHDDIDFIRINQIPDPDDIINNIKNLILYLLSIGEILYNIEKLHIPELDTIRDKFDNWKAYVDIFATVLDKIDKYASNFVNIIYEKYRNYRRELISNFDHINKALKRMKLLKNIKPKYAKKLKGKINKYIEELYILQESIKEELSKESLDQEIYKSTEKLMDYIYNNLDRLDVEDTIKIMERGIPYIKMTEIVMEKVFNIAKNLYI